ncbi:MAG: GAF domain-containing sensor histidine kinase [Gemmatimonadaceae bacterium]
MSLTLEAVLAPVRLAALNESGLLDSESEPAFDRLTQLVTRVLGVPVALISLVDKDRQFFKSQCGLPGPWAAARETPLSHSFCQHVVASQEALLVTDARENDLVRHNLAIPDLGVIAYAGVPVIDADGFILGSLCAIDSQPREWSDADVQLLRALSAQVSVELQLRSRSRRLNADLETQAARSVEQRLVTQLSLHDIRTPLSAILQGMSVIRFLGDVSDAQETYLSMCERNGNELLNIVDNMLDIGIIEQRGTSALHRGEHAVASVVDAATEQVELLADDKKITTEVQFARIKAVVYADRDKLLRVLVNLLANAIKFTQPTGHIVLRTDDVEQNGVRMIQFSIKDNGSGIANPDDIFRDGGVITRESTTRQSTGLGLVFCRRVVETHGGQIWAESELGVGSTFYFTLPAPAP